MNKNKLIPTLFILALLAFTAYTTAIWVIVATPAEGFMLYLRVGIGILVTDGAVLFWSFQTRALPTDRQRKWAGRMLALSILVVGALAVSYVPLQVLELGEYKFWLEVGAPVVLSLWVVSNIAARQVIEWLDPDVILTVDKNNTDGLTALERNSAYRESMAVLRPVFAKAQSLRAVRSYAESNGHTPAEVQAIVSEAGAALDKHYGQSPVTPDSHTSQTTEAGESFPFGKNGRKSHQKREKVTPEAIT